MTFYHPEEDAQVWALECFDEEQAGSRYLIEFADSEAYVGELETAYDSDNAGELGIEIDDPLYDEFHQVVIKVISEVNGGPSGVQRIRDDRLPRLSRENH